MKQNRAPGIAQHPGGKIYIVFFFPYYFPSYFHLLFLALSCSFGTLARIASILLLMEVLNFKIPNNGFSDFFFIYLVHFLYKYLVLQSSIAWISVIYNLESFITTWPPGLSNEYLRFCKNIKCSKLSRKVLQIDSHHDNLSNFYLE